MSRKKIDPNQLCFDFDRHIEEYRGLKEKLLTCNNKDGGTHIENWEEGCIAQAAAIKKAIRQSNMSREQVVDAINDYFGWPKADPGKGKHLSIHMINHYLSKPVEYPIPAFYLYAIQHITKSLTDPVSGRGRGGAGDIR